VLRGDAEKTATASPNNTDHLVALLIARPEIKSVSDLTSKIVAIAVVIGVECRAHHRLLENDAW